MYPHTHKKKRLKSQVAINKSATQFKPPILSLFPALREAKWRSFAFPDKTRGKSRKKKAGEGEAAEGKGPRRGFPLIQLPAVRKQSTHGATEPPTPNATVSKKRKTGQPCSLRCHFDLMRLGSQPGMPLHGRRFDRAPRPLRLAGTKRMIRFRNGDALPWCRAVTENPELSVCPCCTCCTQRSRSSCVRPPRNQHTRRASGGGFASTHMASPSLSSLGGEKVTPHGLIILHPPGRPDRGACM